MVEPAAATSTETTAPLKPGKGEEEIKLTQLDSKIKYSLEDGMKYQLIFDSSGECENFFRYSAKMVDVHKLNLSIALGNLTKEEAIEQMRKQLLFAMRGGDRLVLNCGKGGIDFVEAYNDPVNFPTDKIFDFAEWRKVENYKSIVREEEDVDMMGNKKCYYMNHDFTIIILLDIKDVKKDGRDEQKARIPHFRECFETFFVVKQEVPAGQPPQPSVNPFAAFGGGVDVSKFVKPTNKTGAYQSIDYGGIYGSHIPNRK